MIQNTILQQTKYLITLLISLIIVGGSYTFAQTMTGETETEVEGDAEVTTDEDGTMTGDTETSTEGDMDEDEEDDEDEEENEDEDEDDDQEDEEENEDEEEDDNEEDEEEDEDNKDENKIFVCHTRSRNPKTLEIDKEAKEAHLNHGDYEGKCESDKNDEEENDEEDNEEEDEEENGTGDMTSEVSTEAQSRVEANTETSLNEEQKNRISKGVEKLNMIIEEKVAKDKTKEELIEWLNKRLEKIGSMTEKIKNSDMPESRKALIIGFLAEIEVSMETMVAELKGEGESEASIEGVMEELVN